jgi:AcrR family transcriptional regulator
MFSRKERERAKRLEVLLEAAGLVFGRKPFDEATMQDVAIAAEISIQGLYEFFPSKQEMYEQVMLYFAGLFHEHAEAALANAPAGPIERLNILARVYVQHFQDVPFTLPRVVRDRVQFDFGFDTRFRQRYQEVYQSERHRVTTILREAIDSGALCPIDPEFLTQLVLDVFQASLHFAYSRTPREEVGPCVERAMHCLLYGIAAH